jgi:outer membrane protein assembly factor BamA
LQISVPVRALLLLALVAGCTSSPAEADGQGPRVATQQIQSVALDGGRGLPLAALRAVLATHRGDQLDANRLVKDRSALEAELAQRGYLEARVEPATVTFSSSGGAYITFEIAAGRVYRLGAVTVKGASPKDAVVTLTTGDDALAERIERARQTLADNLERHGKPANVTVALRPDRASATVDVELTSR